MRNRKSGMATPGFVLAVVIAGLAFAGEEEVEGTRKCIQINRISSIRILGSQHIRFETFGGPDYMNILPHKCPGLSNDRPILYKSTINRLCDLDTITVLYEAGGGFMRGATCGLGKFVPIEGE